MDKTKPIPCFCTKPWNCGYNEDGRCDFYNESCDKICIAYGGGVPMTNRDASAALGCALQWNGSGQYDHDAAKEAVRVAQAALEKIPQMEDHFRELTKMHQQLERERDAAVEAAHGVCKACIHYNGHYPPGDVMSCCKFEECLYGMDEWDVEDHWQWRGVQEANYHEK